MTNDPFAWDDSWAVGSNHMPTFSGTFDSPSSTSMSFGLDDKGNAHAEHAATRPNISKPASAIAALAAIDAEATQDSAPSTSRTVINTSMVDLGKSSS